MTEHKARTTMQHDDERHGIQSIEVGFQLLRVLSASNRPMMLRDIAQNAGMPAAKAHRYMVSFLRVGIVAQDSATGRYDLGPYALEVGLSLLGRLDPVKCAGPVLESLCEQIHETVALAVWGTHGATIVRIHDAGGPVTITLRVGTVLSLCKSATGRAFATFGRTPFLKKLLDEELAETAVAEKIAPTALRRQLERNLSEYRSQGLARATGSLAPGINGFSAPVYDHAGRMVAAITSLGSTGEFNAEWDSPVANAMIEAARKLSGQLGSQTRKTPREEN